MMAFAAPAGLLGLLAIAVPIAIHLWSRHRPARIKVGSTRMLQEFVAPRARQLRLTDVPTLLIRISLVALLALLVARPLWTSRRADGRLPVRWLLVQPSVAADGANAAALEELAAAGLETRVLAPGFPLPGGAAGPGAHPLDVWALLAEADRAAPAGSEFTVASTGAAELFGGERPALGGSVVWRDFPAAAEWIDRAVVLASDSLFVSVGMSRPEGTTGLSGVVALTEGTHRVGGAGGPLVTVSAAEGGYSVALAGDTAGAVAVPATNGPVVVTVVHATDRAADARYVELAIAALQRELSLPLAVTTVSSEGRVLQSDVPLPESHILFWLAADSLPGSVIDMVERGAVVIEDGDADDVGWEITLTTRAGLLRGVTVGEGAAPERGEPVWWAGSRPVLSLERVGMGYRYRFAGRFHQGAGTLVLRPEFPRAIFEILEAHLDGINPGRLGRPDRRVVPFEQRTAEARTPEPGAPVERPLHAQLWLLAAAVFGVERMIALRRKR